jgi:sugar-specific transcriptional regulator TrmB
MGRSALCVDVSRQHFALQLGLRQDLAPDTVDDIRQLYILGSMPITVKRTLAEIGLSEKETSVLSVLLERGTMFASAIARDANLNRTTTYGILNELMGKGLVSHMKERGTDRWQSIAPELLPGYIERRMESLAESKKTIENAIPQIKLLREKRKALPKVQFFEGAEGVKQAYEDTLENNKGKMIKAISGIDAALERLGEEWANYYWHKRVKLGVKAAVLSPEGEWARYIKANDEKHLRVTKFLPERFGFKAEVSLYDNKVGIFSYAQESPVALIIEDDTIADALNKMFDYIESTVT